MKTQRPPETRGPDTCTCAARKGETDVRPLLGRDSTVQAVLMQPSRWRTLAVALLCHATLRREGGSAGWINKQPEGSFNGILSNLTSSYVDMLSQAPHRWLASPLLLSAKLFLMSSPALNTDI